MPKRSDAIAARQYGMLKHGAITGKYTTKEQKSAVAILLLFSFRLSSLALSQSAKRPFCRHVNPAYEASD